MANKNKKLQQSLREEKVRFKLYKAGKHWIKAGLKEIELLRIMGMPFSHKKIEKDIHTEIDKTDDLKKELLKKSAVVGGALATMNLIDGHQAFAASELPVSSELSSMSQTVANQHSTSLTASSSETSSTSSNANSTSNSTEHSTQSSSTSTEKQTNSQSDDSSDNNSQESASDSHASSASNTNDDKSETSLSNSKSEASSSPNSSLASDDKSSHSDSDKRSSTSSSLKTSQSTSSSIEDSETLTKDSVQTSQSASSSIKKAQSTSAPITDSETLTKSSEQISQSTSDSIASNSTSTSISSSPLSFRTFAATPTMTYAAAAATTSTSYIGSGTDKYNNVPIYYYVTITNNADNTMTFVYTVTYDNPNTATVEKPDLRSNTVTMNTWGTATTPMIKLGSGYGTPTDVTSGLSTWNDPNTFLKSPAPKSFKMTQINNGYGWTSATITPYNVSRGYGITSIFTVPINNPNGDLKFTFIPYASQNDTSVGKENYFNTTITGNDPV